MRKAAQEFDTAGLRERKKLQTRRDLLKVAQVLFSENEFEDVTVDQIADLAVVSPKTFFNYFQNKSQYLTEYMFDWLKSIGFWSFEITPIEDCRSAIVPPDAYEQLDWIVKNRRMLKMAMNYTDFLDFIYKLDEHSTEFDPELRAIIREPRRDRVRKAQKLGIVREDVPADVVCRMYDALRIDVVRRWLYLGDDDARPEMLRNSFDTHLNALVKGISA